jgi:hypothetical protein
MPAKAREFIDFWIENSVHPREPYGVTSAEQGAEELVRRLVKAAGAQGVSEKDMTAEVGDLTEFIRSKLWNANQAEKDRKTGHS